MPKKKHFYLTLTGLKRKHQTYHYGAQPRPVIPYQPQRGTIRILMVKHSLPPRLQLQKKKKKKSMFNTEIILRSSIACTDKNILFITLTEVSVQRRGKGFYLHPISPDQKLPRCGQ